jgi:hypothetical protein
VVLQEGSAGSGSEAKTEAERRGKSCRSGRLLEAAAGAKGRKVKGSAEERQAEAEAERQQQRVEVTMSKAEGRAQKAAVTQDTPPAQRPVSRPIPDLDPTRSVSS